MRTQSSKWSIAAAVVVVLGATGFVVGRIPSGPPTELPAIIVVSQAPRADSAPEFDTELVRLSDGTRMHRLWAANRIALEPTVQPITPAVSPSLAPVQPPPAINEAPRPTTPARDDVAPAPEPPKPEQPKPEPIKPEPPKPDPSVEPKPTPKPGKNEGADPSEGKTNNGVVGKGQLKPHPKKGAIEGEIEPIDR